MKKTKETNSVTIKQLEEQIDKLNKETEMTKKSIKGKGDITKERMLSDNSLNVMDCKLCEMTFDRFVDLENHIRTCHANHQVFHCDKYEKGFVLKWRLKKHMRLHTENNVTYCHYFNNDKN